MSTPIKPVPDIVLASEFPTLADRPAGNYNAKAAAWANSENAMAESVREVALNVRNNADATEERAQDAEQSAQTAQQAVTDAQDKVAEAAGHASDAASHAASAAADAVKTAADRKAVEEAIADGPVISVNRQTGIVDLTAQPKTESFTAEVDGNYWLVGDITVSLPDANDLDIGDTVTFSKSLTATPTIEVGAGSAVIQTAKGSDTSVLFDINAEITFIFNGTDWEV